ncbi:MAG: hypothetical protein HY727_20750 [Candidatus Rokubacteria bacterium]|nr:hypothetical protein [Candidatus Rokubacteria bacterium]
MIAAGFGVALVEALGLPKGSIWVVVAVAVLLAGLIRVVTARKPGSDARSREGES